MAQYTKNPEVIEAVQWTKEGDHADIKALTVTGVKAKEICTSCGQPMSAHGMRVLDESLHDTLCPGWWVVTGEDGLIEYVKGDTKFKARFTTKDKTE